MHLKSSIIHTNEPSHDHRISPKQLITTDDDTHSLVDKYQTAPISHISVYSQERSQRHPAPASIRKKEHHAHKQCRWERRRNIPHTVADAMAAAHRLSFFFLP